MNSFNSCDPAQTILAVQLFASELCLAHRLRQCALFCEPKPARILLGMHTIRGCGGTRNL
jgi:hypothetical protein